MTAPLQTLSVDVLWEELWISLGSLLRSYAAAHGLNADRQAEVEMDRERMIARHHGRRLELTRTGATIRWQRENGRGGAVEMTEAGRLRSGAGEEEMDMAAEAWVRELMRTAETAR